MTVDEALLTAFVEKVASRLESIEPPYYVTPGADCRSYIQSILNGIDSTDLAGELVPVVGEDRLKAFYAGCILPQCPLAIFIASYLWDNLPPCCQISADYKIEVDSEKLLGCLKRYIETIHTGDMEIVTSLRVANIDIAADFDLAQGIRFRKVPAELIWDKYPVDTDFIGVSRAEAESWSKHCVEVVFHRRGKGKELDQIDHHEWQEADVNAIVQSFQMSGLQEGFRASVTHFRCDTPFRSRCHTRSVFVHCEPKLLTSDHIEQLQSTYDFLVKVKSDQVLRSAVDRFLLGLSRTTHHPTSVNQPNWDKIVDYVIAMESLFVPGEGSELSYRLALNGSSLIHLAIGSDRQRTFHALKRLYGLRSKIVHGRVTDFAKTARKFLKDLGVTGGVLNDRLLVYHEVRKRVEGWLRTVLFFLGTVQPPDRPYKRRDGWEELLWSQFSLIPTNTGNDYY